MRSLDDTRFAVSMPRVLTPLLLLLMATALGGCKSVPTQWARSGATQQELWSDRSFCTQKSDRWAVAGAGASARSPLFAIFGLYAADNSFVNCMKELGWQSGSEFVPDETIPSKRNTFSDEEIAQLQQVASSEAQEIRATPGSLSRCSIGIWTGDGTTILRLSDSARRAGFLAGDNVIRIGLFATPVAEDVNKQIRFYAPDDAINVTVERNSEHVAITADCEDERPALLEWIAALDAVSDGRWADCIFGVSKYEDEAGYVSSITAAARAA